MKFINRIIVRIIMLQNTIVTHESNGLAIIIDLILSDINPLAKHRVDLVLTLKVRLTFLYNVYHSFRSYTQGISG